MNINNIHLTLIKTLNTKCAYCKLVCLFTVHRQECVGPAHVFTHSLKWQLRCLYYLMTPSRPILVLVSVLISLRAE